MKTLVYITIALVAASAACALDADEALSMLLNDREPVVVLDLNNDGLDELVEVQQQYRRMLVYQNMGGTNLVLMQELELTPSGPYLVAAADFDDDGIPDVAVNNYGPGAIEIYHGTNGCRLDATASLVFAEPGTRNMFAADFLTNGIPDLLVFQPETYSATLITNAGARVYDSTNVVLATGLIPMDPTDLDVAAVDGDAVPDLAFLGASGNNVDVRMYAGDVVIDNYAPLIMNGDTFVANTRCRILDLDASDLNDLLIYKKGSSNPLGICYGDSGGFWTRLTSGYRALPAKVGRLTTADVNADGVDDVVLLDETFSDLYVCYNDGAGYFTNYVQLAGAAAGCLDRVIAGHFSSTSGPPDLIVGNFTFAAGPGGGTNLTELWVNDGAGNFAQTNFSRELPSPFTVENRRFKNVLMTNGEDVESPAFEEYGSLHIDDWTESADPVSNAAVRAATWRKVGAALQWQGTNIYDVSGVSVTDVYPVVVNQLELQKSVFFLAEPELPDPLWADVSPPGGTYNQTVSLSFTGNGTDVRYRLNGGAYQTYASTSPPALYQDALVRFYAVGANDSSPVYVQSYTIDQPDTADTDGDGLPDNIEDELGTDIFVPNGDSDGDGWSDIEERVRGSDPETTNSVPADSDGDGWSNFDEAARGTSSSDSNDFPVARNLYAKELLLSGTLYGASNGVPLDDGAEATLVGFTGSEAGPVDTQTVAGAYSVRASGHRDYILVGRSLTNRNIVTMRFIEECEPVVPAVTGYCATASAFLDAYKESYTNQCIEVRSNQNATVLSTTSTKVLERLVNVQLATMCTQSVDHAFWQGEFLDTEYAYAFHTNWDFDALPAYFEDCVTTNAYYTTNILDVVSLVISNVTDDTNCTAHSADILHKLMAGEDPGTQNLPPELDATARVNHYNAVQALIGVDSVTFSISGTVVVDADGNITLDWFGTVYELTGQLFDLRTGVQIQATGRTAGASALDGADHVFLCSSYTILAHPPAPPCVDTDNDNLCDELEYFYFGDLSHAGHEDYDGDGYSNLSEFDGVGNPILSNVVSIYDVAYVQPEFVDVETTNASSLQLSFEGYAGYVYQLQDSADIRDTNLWSDVPGETLIGANATQAFEVVTPPGPTSLIYRIRISN